MWFKRFIKKFVWLSFINSFLLKHPNSFIENVAHIAHRCSSHLFTWCLCASILHASCRQRICIGGLFAEVVVQLVEIGRSTEHTLTSFSLKYIDTVAQLQMHTNTQMYRHNLAYVFLLLLQPVLSLSCISLLSPHSSVFMILPCSSLSFHPSYLQLSPAPFLFFWCWHSVCMCAHMQSWCHGYLPGQWRCNGYLTVRKRFTISTEFFAHLHTNSLVHTHLLSHFCDALQQSQTLTPNLFFFFSSGFLAVCLLTAV